MYIKEEWAHATQSEGLRAHHKKPMDTWPRMAEYSKPNRERARIIAHDANDNDAAALQEHTRSNEDRYLCNAAAGLTQRRPLKQLAQQLRRKPPPHPSLTTTSSRSIRSHKTVPQASRRKFRPRAIILDEGGTITTKTADQIVIDHGVHSQRTRRRQGGTLPLLHQITMERPANTGPAMQIRPKSTALPATSNTTKQQGGTHPDTQYTVAGAMTPSGSTSATR